MSQLKGILGLRLDREETLKAFLSVFKDNPLHLDARRHPYHTLVGIELEKALKCGRSAFCWSWTREVRDLHSWVYSWVIKVYQTELCLIQTLRSIWCLFCRDISRDWFRLARISPDGEGKGLFELFLVDKRFVRGCVMRFFYGQKGYGRWVFWKSLQLK